MHQLELLLQALPPAIIYLIVGTVIGLESMGIPLPGEVALVTASLLAATGYTNPWLVATAATIGAIVGDQFFQRGTPGLGVLIQVSTSRLNGPGTFAAILTASLLGVAVFLLFGWLRTLVVGRWNDTV